MSESALPTPVSVVIAWVNSFELLQPGLDALQNQSGRAPAEVIVVTRRGEDDQSRLRRAYPSVIVLPAPPGTSIPALRSLGIKHARGAAAVAVTEDHCVPCGDWISRIEQGIASGCAVIGGPVENAWTRRQRDWAAFLTEYAGAIRGGVAETVSQLPGNNVAYHRDLTAGLCATLDRGQWESFFHRQLAAGGVRFAFDPEMVVHHRRPFGFGYFVSQRYHFSRSFAAMRNQSLTVAGRLVYAMGSALLPPLLVVRGFQTLRGKQRFVGRYVACLPLIGIYVTVGAIGEMVGYALGGGNSLERVE